MSDLMHKLAEMRELPTDVMSDGQIERTIREGDRRYRRQKRTRAAVAVFTMLFAIGAGAGLLQRLRAPDTVLLADGSKVMLIGADSKMRVARSEPGEVEVALERGSGRFDVVHDPKRRFHVVAGDVVIEVIGTQFVVELSTNDVIVRVERGRVRVVGRGVDRFVSTGESADFKRSAGATPPTVDEAVAQTAANDDRVNDAPTPAEPLRLPEVALPDDDRRAINDKLATHDGQKRQGKDSASAWRASAARGNYEAAYKEMNAAGTHVVRDIAEELMLAADVARWSHHPAAAVPYLERVVREHTTDPRSQLAAFTLGRVLLDELGRPREAAAAFARARALDADGPLAGDALAREVEAWSRAGDNANALARAEDYLARYPHGPHATSVRRFGRLE